MYVFVYFVLFLPDHVGGILIDIAYVGVAEAVVDWVKHAFITKFNEISSEVSICLFPYMRSSQSYALGLGVASCLIF